MKGLSQLENNINEILSIEKKDNIIDVLMQTKRYRRMKKHFSDGIIKQIGEIVRSGVVGNITDQIGKAEDIIFTDADLISIRNEIDRVFGPLSEFVEFDEVEGFLIWSTEQGGQNLLNNAGLDAVFNLKNKDYLRILQKETELIISSVDKTTKDWIANQIFSGKKSKKLDTEIANDLIKKIPDFSEHRAETIVRTEMNNAVNQGEFETARRNKAQRKWWITVGDKRVSEACQFNHSAGWIGMDQVFPSSGRFRPPEHPNCRCHLKYEFLPIVDQIWAGE